jgi:hypothetical protein
VENSGTKIQCDQIGQIFAYWVITHFWQFFANYLQSRKFFRLHFSTVKGDLQKMGWVWGAAVAQR